MAVKMRTENKGLTVKVNLFALDKYKKSFNSAKARLWMKGTVTTSDGKNRKMFNDAGELITILGRWNAQKLRSLQKGK